MARSSVLVLLGMVLGSGLSLRWPSVGDSPQAGPAVSGTRHDLAPLTGFEEFVSVTPEQSMLMCSGFLDNIYKEVI